MGGVQKLTGRPQVWWKRVLYSRRVVCRGPRKGLFGAQGVVSQGGVGAPVESHLEMRRRRGGFGGGFDFGGVLKPGGAHGRV